MVSRLDVVIIKDVLGCRGRNGIWTLNTTGTKFLSMVYKGGKYGLVVKLQVEEVEEWAWKFGHGHRVDEAVLACASKINRTVICSASLQGRH